MVIIYFVKFYNIPLPLSHQLLVACLLSRWMLMSARCVTKVMGRSSCYCAMAVMMHFIPTALHPLCLKYQKEIGDALSVSKRQVQNSLRFTGAYVICRPFFYSSFIFCMTLLKTSVKEFRSLSAMLIIIVHYQKSFNIY